MHTEADQHPFCLPPPVFTLQGQQADCARVRARACPRVAQIVFYASTHTHAQSPWPASICSLAPSLLKRRNKPGLTRVRTARGYNRPRATVHALKQKSQNLQTLVFSHTLTHARSQSCRCFSVRSTDCTLPVMQKSLDTWSRKRKDSKRLRKQAVHISAQILKPHIIRAQTRTATRARIQTRWRQHKRAYISFAFLPSSCIRCRQKVRFSRQPGMLLRSRRGRAAEDEGD